MLDRLAWVGRDDEGRRTSLGDRARLLSELDEALRQYQRAVELRPSAANFRNVVAVHAQRGDFTAAQATNDALLRVQPDDPDALLAAGALRLHFDDPEGALALFERSDAVRPGHAAVQALVARARERITQRAAGAAGPVPPPPAGGPAPPP
jgi:tetratricopeptide (TPR) repeat protein